MTDADVIAAVGVRYGRHLTGVRSFLKAGSRVALFDLGVLGDSALDHRQQAEVDRLLGRWPEQLAFIDRLGGDMVADILARDEKGAAAVLTETSKRFGGVNVVFLGPWWGVTDYRVGEDFLAALAARDGGELIATEPGCHTDHTLRWIKHWARQSAASGVSAVVLREPRSRRQQAAPNLARRSSKAYQILLDAGWVGPLTLRDANQVAKQRILSGGDRLAGRRWHYVTEVAIETGRCMVGDAAAIDEALADADEYATEDWWPTMVTSGGEVIEADDTVAQLRERDGDMSPDPRTHPNRGNSTSGSPSLTLRRVEWPLTLSVTSDNDKLVGVRLGVDGDTWDFAEAIQELIEIETTSVLRIGDPYYLLTGGGFAAGTSPGRWIVEGLVHASELIGVRLRRVAPRAPRQRRPIHS